MVHDNNVSQQWKWLSNINLKKETKGLIIAAQNQAIAINCIKVNFFGCALYRLCGRHVESVDHILSSCSVIAQAHYKSRHDSVARLIHHEIAKLDGFSVDDR